MDHRWCMVVAHVCALSFEVFRTDSLSSPVRMDVYKRWSSACGWCCFLLCSSASTPRWCQRYDFPATSLLSSFERLGADRWISDGMKGSEKRRDVYKCGQLCGSVEFHAEVSVGGSDGVVTSAHLEFGSDIATVSARYLWATARRPGSDIAKPRMSSYTLLTRGNTCRRGWLQSTACSGSLATDTPRLAMCNGGTTRLKSCLATQSQDWLTQGQDWLSQRRAVGHRTSRHGAGTRTEDRVLLKSPVSTQV